MIILERGKLPIQAWVQHIIMQAFDAYDAGDVEFVNRVKEMLIAEGYAWTAPGEVQLL